jgi:hypothetical protein
MHRQRLLDSAVEVVLIRRRWVSDHITNPIYNLINKHESWRELAVIIIPKSGDDGEIELITLRRQVKSGLTYSSWRYSSRTTLVELL